MKKEQNNKDFRRLIEWCLKSSGKCFMHIQDESLFMMSDDEWILPCTRPTGCVLAHEGNNPQEDMPLYPDTLFRLWIHQSLPLLLNAACKAEKQKIQILMFLAWPSRGSNEQPSALEASTLTITPRRRSISEELAYKQWKKAFSLVRKS